MRGGDRLVAGVILGMQIDAGRGQVAVAEGVPNVGQVDAVVDQAGARRVPQPVG